MNLEEIKKELERIILVHKPSDPHTLCDRQVQCYWILWFLAEVNNCKNLNAIPNPTFRVMDHDGIEIVWKISDDNYTDVYIPIEGECDYIVTWEGEQWRESFGRNEYKKKGNVIEHVRTMYE